MGKSRVNKQCTFQDVWLHKNTHPEFSPWLGYSTLSKNHAYCKFCNWHINIAVMGISAVKSHAKGDKHKDRVANHAKSQLFRDSLSTPQPTNAPASTSTSAPASTSANCILESASTRDDSAVNRCDRCKCNLINSMDNYVKKEDVTKAEIIWALNHADKKKSARCSGEESDLFPLMFSDSEIAKKYEMQKDKICYSITYGLGPHFQSELANNVRNCEFYTASFDESLNKFAKKGQMDVILRFWPEGKTNVDSRYLTSTFLQRATAADLFAAFKGEALDKHGLSVKKLLQVSLDGPNVNKKFLKDLAAYLNVSEDAPQLLDIGHCILHIVHGSYKTAHDKCKWMMNKFLRAMYYHFYKSPSRRGAYTECTESNLFPEKYCATRFLENSKTLKRVDEMLDKGCAEYFSKLKANEKEDNNDKTNNVATIQEFLKDVFLRPKIRFMLSVSSEIEPFLTRYQTDWPMTPFMRNDLFALIKDIMSRVVKEEILSTVKSLRDLQKIDLTLQSNLLPAHSVHIGIATNTSISALKKSNHIKDIEILQFKNKCKEFLVKICQMLLQKAPLSSTLLQGAACLSPYVMLKERTAKNRVQIALTHLVEKNRFNAIEADKVQKEYCQLISKKTVIEKLKMFDVSKDRVDTFLFELFSTEKVSERLLKFSKMILIMFHGNADVERSFSYNKEFLVENQQEDSLIALRSVHDAIRAAGDVKDVHITSDMIKAFSKAPAHRKKVLDEKQSEISKEKAAKKRAADQLADIELKTKRLKEEHKQELNLLNEEAARLKKMSK